MILVTGAGGMTSRHLSEVYESELFRTDVVETSGVRQMDVRDSDAVMRTVGEIRPSLVLHLAAETDLERCERELPHAYQTNVIGTLNVVLAAKK
jgi:dTDP-4-dehydrorhamnose reductase